MFKEFQDLLKVGFEILDINIRKFCKVGFETLLTHLYLKMSERNVAYFKFVNKFQYIKFKEN